MVCALPELGHPLALTALMHAYEAAFVSWGRHAALVPEQTRVSVFLQALSQRNKDYMGVPGSPLRVPDTNVTFRQCCDWLRTFESFGPTEDQLLLDAAARSAYGAAPVSAAPRAPSPPYPPRAGGRGGADRAGRGRGRSRPEDGPWGTYGSAGLCCVRCHQRGHAASCCETVMTPAAVRANVLQCWEARKTGACFVCASLSHRASEWTPCRWRL